MKIEFMDFPFDFDVKNNFFNEWITGIHQLKNKSYEICFYGCYPKINFVKKSLIFALSRRNPKYMIKWLNHQQGLPQKIDDKKFNIWCTFENRRPPHGLFDLTLSFDSDNYSQENFYLPLIYLYIDLLKSKSSHLKHNITIDELQKPRSLTLNDLKKKTFFAGAFINNPHPTRLRAISELQRISEVKVYGRLVNNYVEEKINELEKYWFNLCFENDLFPGYVTEKVLESWLSRAIPLYWGDDECGILNDKAIINLKNFESMDLFVDYVKDIYSSDKKMLDMINQPLLKKDVNLSELEEVLVSKLQAKFSS